MGYGQMFQQQPFQVGGMGFQRGPGGGVPGFIGDMAGKIGGGIHAWWDEMDPLGRGQVVGGALTGLAQYLQQQKENEFRDRQLDLSETAYADEEARKRRKKEEYDEWVARNAR